MKKIIALVLSLVMIVCVFASCNKGGDSETKITVKISIENDGEEMYPLQEVTLTKTEDFTPTVYDAVIQLLEDNEAEYKTSTLGSYNIITSIDGVTETDDKFWQILVDGDEPDARYAALPIAEGNEILFFCGKNLQDTGTTAPATTEEPETYETADDGYED